MARLDFPENTTCWLKAETLVNLTQTPASTDIWHDSSGFGRNFVLQGTGLTILHDAVNGYPALDFDGTAAYAIYTGNLSDLIAAAQGAVFSVFRANSIGTNDATIPQNDPVWAADSGTGAGLYLRTAPEAIAFNSPDTRVRAIQTGVWYVHMWRHRGSRLAAALDDALTYEPDVGSGATPTVNVDVFLGKNHQASPKFADITIAEMIFLDIAPADQDCATIVNYLAAKFGVRGDAQAQANNVGARSLWELREPSLRVSVPALPPSAFDLDAGDVVGLVHREIPHPAGLGAGIKNWERLPLTIREVRPNLDELSVRLLGQRVRQHTFYAAAKAAAVPGQGLAVSAVDPGPILIRRQVPGAVVTRDGIACIVRSADGLAEVIKDGLLKIEPNGVLCEVEATQQVTDSAMVAAAPEWSFTNPTGGTVAYENVTDAGMQVFDSIVTTRCVKFTRGTSGTGIAAVPLLSDATSELGIIQIDIRGNLTGLSYRLREVGGTQRYWDNATDTWGVGVVDNAITDPGDGQYVSNSITFLGGATTYTFEIRQATGVGSVSDVARVFYCGIHQSYPPTVASARLRWPCSRMPSNHATIALSMGQDFGPVWPNHSGRRNLNAGKGAILMRLRHRFNTSQVVNVDATALQFVLLHAYYDVNNEILLHYYRDSAGAVAEYRLDVKASGTTYRAVKPHTVVRDAIVNVWARWTSAADGELDKPARTLTVGVEGVAGSDVAAGGLPTETSQAWLGVGASAQPAPPSHFLLPLCGWWSNVEILAECPTDAELNAWRL